MEFFGLELVMFAGTMIVVPFLITGLARLCDRVLSGPPSLRRLLAWLRQLRIWHLLVTVAVVALVLAAFLTEDATGIMLGALAVLVLVVRIWLREFVRLMSLRDDELPGRYDKPLWALLMIVLPPVGVWVFRSFRLDRQAALAPAVVEPELEPAYVAVGPEAVPLA